MGEKKKDNKDLERESERVRKEEIEEQKDNGE